MQALAILSILLTWAFYALICVGLGAWLPRTKSANPDLADHFLAGLATLLALLQLWHFLAPISFITHITLILRGRQLVNDGELEFGPGDYIYGPPDTPHGPFDYPEDCELFVSFFDDAIHSSTSADRATLRPDAGDPGSAAPAT